MNRFEQAIPAGIITLVGLWVAFISFTQQPAEAFSFPRLISAVFVVLSIWVFVQALIGNGASDEANSIPWKTWANILPGLIIAAIYIFWAAKALGFYTATVLAVFVLVTYYDPSPHGAVKSWIRRIIVTAGFVAVMYLLFGTLLGVFTPSEVLFR